MAEHASLVLLDKAKRELALMESVQDVKEIRDTAEAYRIRIKQAKAGLELQNKAAEIKLRAERRAGELLASMDRQQGGRPKPSHDGSVSPTLADLDITPNQSSRWQSIASIPEEDFEEEIKRGVAEEKELTSTKMLQTAKRILRRGQPKPPEPPKPTILDDVATVQETNKVSDLVMGLSQCAEIIRTGYKKWTTSNQARTCEAVEEVVHALKGAMS